MGPLIEVLQTRKLSFRLAVDQELMHEQAAIRMIPNTTRPPRFQDAVTWTWWYPGMSLFHCCPSNMTNWPSANHDYVTDIQYGYMPCLTHLSSMATCCASPICPVWLHAVPHPPVQYGYMPCLTCTCPPCSTSLAGCSCQLAQPTCSCHLAQPASPNHLGQRL